MLNRMIMLAAAAAVITGAFLAGGQARAKDKQATSEKVICPVLGNEVKDIDKAEKSVYKGKTYYFCCAGCKPKFDADPEKYLGKASEHEGNEGHGSHGGHMGHGGHGNGDGCMSGHGGC